MARKSRFTEQTTAACAAKRWQAALYIRLSREDGDKEESDSVQNQRSLLRAYLENEPELTLADVYVDDGYTGTNFDRPGFSRMMEKIRQKQINCVIVKDLSRFGRNYIEVGKYIEQIFPFLDVRFISVGDMLDSYKNPQAMNNLIVPFKNIINDEYCRDISNKVRSSLDMKRKRGDFIVLRLLRLPQGPGQQKPPVGRRTRRANRPRYLPVVPQRDEYPRHHP